MRTVVTNEPYHYVPAQDKLVVWSTPAVTVRKDHQMADANFDQKNLVRSVAKCFRVLEAFSGNQPELLLSEVARSAGLDNATAFRLLNTLVSLGYVEKVSDSRRFRLTLKCLDLGFNAIARMDMRSLAQPILRSLLAQGGEAASIGVLDGGDAVFIERLQPGMTRLAVNIRRVGDVPCQGGLRLG